MRFRARQRQTPPEDHFGGERRAARGTFHRDGLLSACGWSGKRFDSEEHVHPLLFASGGREFPVHPRRIWPGVPLLLRFPRLRKPALARVARLVLPLLATRHSRARLRMTRFRGVLTATMVYDDVPIQDVFRRIDDATMLGLMDLKGLQQPFFFLLRRRQAVPRRRGAGGCPVRAAEP